MIANVLVVYKVYIRLFLLLFIVSCSDPDLPPGRRGGGFLLSDPSTHENAINALRKENIPYEVDQKGRVIFLLRDQAKVHGILRNVQYGEALSRSVLESVVLVDEELVTKYEHELTQANIPYRLYERGSDWHIEWVQIYGPKVDVLRQKIDQEMSDEKEK